MSVQAIMRPFTLLLLIMVLAALNVLAQANLSAVKLGASSSTQAQAVLPAGANPSSMTAGNVNNDSGQNALTMFIGGLTQTFRTDYFTSISDVNVNNTTAETTILPASSNLVPAVAPAFSASYWKPGKTFVFYTCGLFSDTSAPTLRFRDFLGATAVASSSAQTLPSGVTNRFWEHRVRITCRTTGASGTFSVQGTVRIKATAIDATAEWEMTNNGTVTADTTTSMTFDCKVTFGTASTSNSITNTIAYGSVSK